MILCAFSSLAISLRHSASLEYASESKPTVRHLTVVWKKKALDMVKEVKSLTAIGCCLRVNPHNVGRITEAEWRIRKTAESTSDWSEKVNG